MRDDDDEREPAGVFVFAYRIIKWIAGIAGGALTLVSLTSLTGAFIDNGWVRLAIALVVALGAPLFIADRMIPEDDPLRGRGIPTDVLCVFWIAFALLFVGVGISFTKPLLLAEGERFEQSRLELLARGVYWVAGASPVAARARPRGGATRGPNAPAARDAGPAPRSAAPTPQPPQVAAAPTDGGAAADGAVAAESAGRTPADIFQEYAAAVVSISSGPGGGTGFFLDRTGLIATNHHVIAPAHGPAGLSVKLFDGSVIERVEVLARDAEDDLALLRVHTERPIKAVDLGDSDATTIGERVVSIGNPLGLEHTMTDGIVSARRMRHGRPFIQTSAPVSPGNSGGPLFNMRGAVIGITTESLSAFGLGEGLSFAVPVNVLKRLVREYPTRQSRAGTDRW